MGVVVVVVVVVVMGWGGGLLNRNDMLMMRCRWLSGRLEKPWGNQGGVFVSKAHARARAWCAAGAAERLLLDRHLLLRWRLRSSLPILPAGRWGEVAVRRRQVSIPSAPVRICVYLAHVPLLDASAAA